MADPGKPDNPARPDGSHKLRQYNASQLRMDTWNQLQVNSNWLREFSRLNRALDEPRDLVAEDLDTLRILEAYWAFPGGDAMAELTALFEEADYDELARRVAEIARLLIGDAYRTNGGLHRLRRHEEPDNNHTETPQGKSRLYFEALIVDDIDAEEMQQLRDNLHGVRADDDEFVYDIVSAPSVEDAVIAVLFNRTIQTVVLRYNCGFLTKNRHVMFERYLEVLENEGFQELYGLPRSIALGRLIKKLRPEIDLFLVTDTPLEEVAGRLGADFRRAFYRLEAYQELHLSILKGIQERYEAPFFDALRRFSLKPAGVFHALPVARGKSMTNSHWARELLDFYGRGVFLAETSATSGGLDSLLQPRGPIKKAQTAAARAFGADETFFVTNGTSTANKIVVQALVQPGDIVLIDRDCHKSHHYALMLAGALPVYLDSYPLTPYSMYGAVPLETIKRQLIELRDAGKLDQVRMLLMTNCTFDGITYDPERVMREVLAIKPDMIFLWDEAWFAYAGFSPTLRRRTAMGAAKRLREIFSDPAYRRAFQSGDSWDGGAMPDPDTVRVRVYATQSTHKTLTSLRQGSMIHVQDEDFAQKSSAAFHEAYMTHTSTSPNYQIIASLDIGRRQVELEGYELVHRSIGLAMTLRERIAEHELIRKYFSVLRPTDMIPDEFRPSGLESYYDPIKGWQSMEDAWRQDELTLDPTRVTVMIANTGLDGDAFRHLLMDEHDIQINKTSRNSALFMTNIGTTRGDIAYLVEVFARIARDIDSRLARESRAGRARHEQKVANLIDAPALPDFSRFHPAFKPGGDTSTPEGDLRKAFFLAYDESAVEFLKLDGSVAASIDAGREVVSAAFITPYPPGFPILVPGQVLSREILAYLHAVGVKEIHGYEPEFGLRIFTDDALERAEGMEQGRRLDLPAEHA
ncbi:MAG: aminotransferase class I/II-fold pyridoxal phosphate-dependent enzyme [Phycisphaeraceae bacterium]|nr:aminotransferase class I/II-fold pyridoxal phosphate-dependent enzyme [Phycisphaeraceae bacterium]MCB9848382.1 aminotransferase class I/II-fold pyridoxal phosphate-dependent enzyme [Phycisphaeraceae bacterium]